MFRRGFLGRLLGDRRGYTLLEAVLAGAVLAVIAVPLLATVQLVLNQQYGEKYARVPRRELAVQLAQQYMEEQLGREFSQMAGTRKTVVREGTEFTVVVLVYPRQWNLAEIRVRVYWDEDGDGVLDEDLDHDGYLDNVKEDLNGNNIRDAGEQDIDGDGHLDCTDDEDLNGNGLLDGDGDENVQLITLRARREVR
ncbi:MAG: hypothetical protein K6U04_11415 [Armatimonadetes bacterium]|nr:hypothetical protein [Armatimonadota bacterium]